VSFSGTGNRPAVERQQLLRAARVLGPMAGPGTMAAQLMRLLCDPHAKVSEIAAVLTTEPGLCARVLRVANSSFYGVTREVTTIDGAVLLLGLDVVRGIAAAASLDRLLLTDADATAADVPAVIRHALASAAAAQLLAGLARPGLEPEAFLGGLLHNLGVLVQLRLDPAGVRRMLEHRAGDRGHGIRALEAQLGVPGHEECLALVFEEWQLPASVIALARHHHEPAEAPEEHRVLTALVGVGATLALRAGATYPLEPEAGACPAGALELLGLGPESLDEVQRALPAWVAALRSALHG